MYIGLIINESKDYNFKYTRELLSFIISQNITPILLDIYKDVYKDIIIGKKADSDLVQKIKKLKKNKILFLSKELLFEKSNFIIIIGGDGTLLRWSTEIAKYNKEILGINKGNLGYLTDVEPFGAKDAIKKVLSKSYITEKRMMLEVKVNNKVYDVLNEASIHSENIGRMAQIGVDINGQNIDNINADGIIVSTPTGSTAYNLSAGGPVLKPDLELMIITYVCPHAIFARPYVISPEDEIELYLNKKDTKGYLSLDGKSNILIKDGDRIKVTKSRYYTNIIKTNKLNFYDILKNKMAKK